MLGRLFRSVVRPPEFLEVTLPHGGIVVGLRAAIIVRARGTGIVGRGADARVVDGDFDGVIFADVDVARSVVVLEASSLLRRHRRELPVVVLARPTVPPAPLPAPPPEVALPPFEVAVEVP